MGGTGIPNNADLNNYKTPGNYYCSSYSAAITLLNCPAKNAFTMKIEYSTGVSAAYISQMIRQYDNGDTYYRRWNGDDGKDIWGSWVKFTTNTDLRFYSTTNGITKIASLPWGIYNLQDSEVRAFTDKPSELNQGRAIIITSGLSTNDEKVALILASSGRDGGVYFGYVWGSNTPEFSWKKIIGNNA